MKYYILLLSLINLFLCKGIIDIQINEDINFNKSQYEFDLNYSKESEKVSIFILFYEKIGNIEINITHDSSRESYTISEDFGNIYFPFKGNGDYYITFISIDEDNTFEGNFKIISSDKPFNLDINKDISFAGFFVAAESEPYPLIITFENLSENYMKRIINEEHKIPKMYISENGNNYKEVINEFIYFNKDTNYMIKLDFLKVEEEFEGKHFYYIHDFSIINLESNLTKIEDFSPGTKLKSNLKYLFTKIDLKENNKFYIKTDGDLKFAYTDNEEQYNNFPNGIQYLKFNNSLENVKFEKFEKPQDKDNMIIFIGFEDQENNLIHFAKEEIIVELSNENQFDAENMLFKFNYEKINNTKALLCFLYEFKNENEETIDILVFNESMYLGSESKVDINRNSFNFLVENSGEYFILLTSIGTVIGNFTIVSSEYEFSIDANKEIYFHNNYNFELEYQSILTFSIINIDKEYKKLYSSNNIENIISYKKKEDERFQQMKSGIFLYEKGDAIIIKLDLRRIIPPDYVHISNLDENNISDLELINYEFLNPMNKIFKINYLTTPYFKIEGDDSNRYYISYIDKERYDTIDTTLRNLTFNKFNDNIYIKPVNDNYGILIVEIVNKMINTNLTISELVPQTIKLYFDSEQIFNSFYSKYELKYEKKENTKEMLIFMYKMNEYSNNFRIKITGPNNYVKTEEFDNKEKIGSYAFENGETGNYSVSFHSENFEGTFKIVNSSDPIKINIYDNIKLNTFITTFEPKPITIEFDNKNSDEFKEILIGENNSNLNLVQISSGDDYKNLTSNYYAFENNTKYKIKIKYNYLGDNQYKFEQFIMNTFRFYLDDFIYGNITYQNFSEIHFIKINLTQFSKIIVKTDKDPIIKIAFYNDDLDMVQILNDLVFEDLKNYNNTIKDESYKKAILMIKLAEKTKIEFSDGHEKNQNDGGKNDGNDDKTVLIALGIVGGVLLLLIIIFLIYRYRKRKQGESDIISGEDKREELMPQLD